MVVINFLILRDQIYVPHSLQVSNNSLSNVVRNSKLWIISSKILSHDINGWLQVIVILVYLALLDTSCNILCMACFAVSKCPVHSFNTFSYCFVLPTETEEYNPEERFVENRLTSDLQGWEGRNCLECILWRFHPSWWLCQHCSASRIEISWIQTRKRWHQTPSRKVSITTDI